ncbi:MAG: DNA adenine methylase [Myxococcales bacterium]|nr:DNA adenine methylase [Myxococcales bacterium]
MERSARADGAAKPFLKWAGGKRSLLPQILPHVPERFGTYHEPFLGGAALFFHLARTRAPFRARLSDTNARLVRTYLAVRDRVEEVIARLASYPHDPEFFAELRARDIDRGSDVEVAAWFVYLNHTGYNGLYRVNSRNRFNVPFGAYARPRYCNPALLRAVARALADAHIELGGFERVAARARRGDFVYFDPPYVPLTATSSFTAYTRDGFGQDDQERLRDVARALKCRGVRVLLSNSSAPVVHDLYRDGFELVTVAARRAVSCRAGGRGPVAELLIR